MVELTSGAYVKIYISQRATSLQGPLCNSSISSLSNWPCHRVGDVQIIFNVNRWNEHQDG